MRLFKITDSRNKTLYITSFGFEQAIADFTRIEAKTKANEKDRAKVVSIKELTNYNGLPATEWLKKAFKDAEKRCIEHPLGASGVFNEVLHEFNELINLL